MKSKIVFLSMVAMLFATFSFAQSYNLTRVGAPTNPNNPNVVFKAGADYVNAATYQYYSSGNTGGSASSLSGTVYFYISGKTTALGSVKMSTITTTKPASFSSSLIDNCQYTVEVSMSYGTLGQPLYFFKAKKTCLSQPPSGGGGF